MSLYTQHIWKVHFCILLFNLKLEMIYDYVIFTRRMMRNIKNLIGGYHTHNTIHCSAIQIMAKANQVIK